MVTSRQGRRYFAAVPLVLCLVSNKFISMPLWWNWQTRVAANSALSASPAGKRKCTPLRLLFPKNLVAQSFLGTLHYFKSLALPLRRRGFPTNSYPCRCGGIGRRKGLKIPRDKTRVGSSPTSGTTSRQSDFWKRSPFGGRYPFAACRSFSRKILLRNLFREP